ncbi:MAG TPA: hypothetical protein VN915_03270, partial [Elusimicrobiota bacterium]|nr:hypothetical protein [Elusimicrobiota bacterium]
TPMEIDRVAEALQNLVDMRSTWAQKSSGAGLEAVYALTRLNEKGERTWTVDQWLTPGEVDARKDLVKRDGRLFINLEVVGDPDHPGRMIRVDPTDPRYKDRALVRYEVIGGVDAAQAEKDAAAKGLADNNTALALADAMDAKKHPNSDFVAVGDHEFASLTFDQVFVGAQSKYAEGRLFFFRATPAKDRTVLDQLTPLAALSMPPDRVVIKLFGGPKDMIPPHDRFPTLESLQGSDAAASFHTLAVSPSGAAQLASHARAYQYAQERRGWIEVKLNSYGFARDEHGGVVQLFRTKDDYSAEWKAFIHAQDDLAKAKADLAQAKNEEADAKKKADDAQTAYTAAMRALSAVRESPEARKAMERQQAAAQAVKDSGRTDGPAKKEFDAAVHAYQALLDASSAKKAFDKAAKAQKEAIEKYKDARAKSTNADKAVADQTDILDHSHHWTLYRADALALSLDHEKDVVRASAPAERPMADSPALALDQKVDGGGPIESTLTGELAAAVVDTDGRLVNSYATGAEVDAAVPNWHLMSVTPTGEVDARLPGEPVRTKVRISHYEENDRPVLLSEKYLIERLDASNSLKSKADHWAIMPYNWGNILLEIPREVAQAPLELIDGRDLTSSHYLGRAMMYKTEGGEVEHHGFFRTALGWVDVLNLLPDPVQRFYDPSQFPDAVTVKSPLAPGQILADKSPRAQRNGKTYDVKFGIGAASRQVREAAEDLDAARQRTLARFNGGVEELTVSMVRGRAGDYEDSHRVVQSGGVKDTDAELAMSPASNGSRPFTDTQDPRGLFVDRVTRRVIVYPGAAGYERQAAAMDGYAKHVEDQDAAARKAHDGLVTAERDAGVKVDRTAADRDAALKHEQETWIKFHELAQRIGTQNELEQRIKALLAEINDLKTELAWWQNYASQLEAAGRGEGPTVPGQPGNPNHPGQPWGGNPMFWAWMLVLFGLGALASAVWYGLNRRSRVI